MTPCVFCAIIADADEHVLVWRDELTVAFLDTRPVFRGHVLVCPRRHVVTLDELEADEMSAVMAVVQRGVRVMRDVLGAQGAFVANNNIVSQSVPHVHVHVIPRTKGDGLRGFFWPRERYGDGEIDDYRARVRAGFLEIT